MENMKEDSCDLALICNCESCLKETNLRPLILNPCEILSEQNETLQHYTHDYLLLNGINESR